jgi:hypothetical protein
VTWAWGYVTLTFLLNALLAMVLWRFCHPTRMVKPDHAVFLVTMRVSGLSVTRDMRDAYVKKDFLF